MIGDHAGNRIPRTLGTLGLSEEQRRRHIAWDIGIAGLGAQLSRLLDATFVAQVYSRLVVDCNRHPDAFDAIAAVSDALAIPGNDALAAADRARRFDEIHEPYQQAIGDELARRDAAGADPVLVSLHSFTLRMADGAPRPWEVGILHDGGDARFAAAVLDRLRADGRWTVGDNQPYRMDVTDYTVPRHAFAARRRYVEFEVRQDLIADEAGQARWAAELARVLNEVGG